MTISVKSAFIACIIFLSIGYFLSDANLMQRFMPRSVCMYRNEKLIMLHFISDMVTAMSYVGIGGVLMSVYRSLKPKKLPFVPLLWQFAGFIAFCGLTHFIGVLNLYVTFYWLDGIIKLMTAWFSILVFISVSREVKALSEIRTPAEFEELKNKLNNLLIELTKK